MPNVMAALQNIGGALCSTPQSLADAHYYMRCSNAAVESSWGAPNSRKDLSRYPAEVHHIVGHVKEILLLNKFFSSCRYMP